MKSFKYLVGFAAALFLTATGVNAKENIGSKRAANKSLRVSAGCVPASSSVELDVNNIRALLHNGWDMWWDLVGNPRYEVPKVENPPDRRYSSFAGSLWIGGVDETGQLRVAAQTYRQSGNDFWPGPLTDQGAAIDEATCEQWDKHWKVTKAEIESFRSAFIVSQIPGGTPLSLDEYPNVKNWPAFGEDSEGNRVTLAPFVDVDGDPLNYSPTAGDYPDISPNPGGGVPDQAVWWVINDKGDVHTETGGEAIGLEIQMLAFAFSTANAINDMTFYKYKVINRSTLVLNDTYMGQWVDADLGNYNDDYVGCDTTRGLGFCYNGNAIDGTAAGYGANPPSFGMDFFQGPISDDGTTRLDMTKFVYYENDFSLRGNPEVATHFYGYLRGYWKDGSRMVNNGLNGYPGTAPGPETDFIYPGELCGTRSGWNEASAGNQPFDRRFLESSGPFTLQAGAVNEIITGAVWARGYYDDQFGSICELISADDIAQALFDANFQLLDGPDAPDLTIGEYDQELVLSWEYKNPTITNNYNESYLQSDPVLVSQGVADSLFAFQGYMIFQLRDNSVSGNELFDTEKARLVAQCDIKDGITTIVNRTTQNAPGLSNPVIVDEIMVTGENNGLYNSIRVTDDLFATGTDRRLKNYTTYYYGALAYAYNDTTSDGRKFVQGNGNFANTPATPHKIDFENFGTVVNTDYGDGIEVTQTAGFGNGGNFLKLTEECENTILANSFSSNITYQANASPIILEVVNPKEIIAGDYRLDVTKQYAGVEDTISAPNATLVIIDSTFSEWVLSESGNPIFTSTYIQRSTRNTGSGVVTIENRPEPLSGTKRVISGHGFAIGVKQTILGSDTLERGLIGATTEYDIPQNSWLAGLNDDDNFNTWDWILAGGGDDDRGFENNPFKLARIYDPSHVYEEVLEGTFAPFCLARGFVNGDLNGRISPGVPLGITANVVDEINVNQVKDLADVPDVDIVFTSDESKWSECVVIETSPAQNLGSGAWPMAARWKAGIDKAGNPVASTPTEQNQGKSWFPGYAINLNTGERLNIFFGESSWDRLNNGDDLVFNPTSDFGPGGTSAGGRHYLYVSNTRYDGCAAIHQLLSNTNATPNPLRNSSMFFTISDPNTDMRQVYDDVVWVGVPMLNGAFDFDDPHEMPSDVRVSLRVSQPFRSRTGTTDYPVFTFNTSEYAAQIGVKDVASKSLMENVRVVPNPYYAHSSYESSQIQTIVKITNLPQKCKIRIFTLNGTLVRTYNKDSDEPEQRWDLKNQNGVPVASGVYIIHVDGFDLGETVVKFFGVMPQIDLNAF